MVASPEQAAAAEELRAEVVAAVLAELERVGPDGLDKAAIVRRFAGRASRATLYRYVDAPLKSGAAARHLAGKVAASASARAARTPDPAADAAREAGGLARAPVPVLTGPAPAPEGVAAAASGPAGIGIPVVEKLLECLRTAEQVTAYARAPDGKVKNARLLLRGNEQIRRTLETCVRLQQAMTELAQVERFHAAVIEEIAKESPELAERVVVRLNQLTAQWNV